MSKITFAYSGKDVADLLSDTPQQIRALILDLQQKHGVRIGAWYSPDYSGSALRIQIEGEPGNLVTTMNDIISQEGLPQIVDQPDPTHFRRLREVVMGEKYVTLSTQDAYQILIERLASAGQNPKTGWDNRTARTKHVFSPPF